MKKKKVIKIYYDKCTGCGQCEIICSLRHLKDTINPKVSRIRVYRDKDEEHFFPVIAGSGTDKECISKNIVSQDGKEYDACILCRTACPAKPWFHDPKTGKPLTCDLCGDCVEWCFSGALGMQLSC